jgi:hypothetical protein
MANKTTSSFISTFTFICLKQGDAKLFANFLERYKKAKAEDFNNIPNRQQVMRLFVKLNATLLIKVS